MPEKSILTTRTANIPCQTNRVTTLERIGLNWSIAVDLATHMHEGKMCFVPSVTSCVHVQLPRTKSTACVHT